MIDRDITAMLEQRRQQEGAFAYIRRDVNELESRLRGLELRRAISIASMELGAQPGWAVLMGKLRDQEKNAMEQLRTTRDVSPIMVARLQEHLRALRLMTLDPLDPDDLAKLEDEDTLLREKIADLKKLVVEQGPSR